MSNSLFSLLYKNSGGRQLENFATAALARLLEDSATVRRSFFSICRSSLPDRKSAVIEALEHSTIRAHPQRTIQVRTPNRTLSMRPDLQIVDAANRFRIIVEVKAFARPTFHELDDDELADARGDQPIQRVVPQTDLYRRWIDEHHASSALLFALTRESERDPILAAPCHGSFDWTALHSAICEAGQDGHQLTKEFCDFLVEEKMVTPPHQSVTAKDRADLELAAAARWDKWEALLDLAVPAILARLEEDTRVRDLKIQGNKFAFWREPGSESRAYSLWKRWVAGTHGGRKFWLTPCIAVDAGPCARLGFDLYLNGWNELVIGGLLPGVSVEKSDDGGVYCLTDFPPEFLSATELRQQAELVADAAFREILEPLLATQKRRPQQRR